MKKSKSMFTIVMLECGIYMISNSSPQPHISRIVRLCGLGVIVKPPVLIAAEEECSIVVAPDEHSIDVRQPFGKSEIRKWLRIASIECVHREPIVFVV